ncbi:hypothetical protein L2E82_24417 [Cichorium intybus]|uniref:Uncharacterized protein n=1 Tax=Cichorium intybus TaxID=13427 RepID=A0ACB9E1R4_CICIN|nr:hypothetical protein L2E82_24417 [Cichorium intybus]
MHDAGNDQSVFSYIKMMFRLDHPFLQFPEGLASSAEYISRRDALTSRRVLEATVIDRDILRDAGLWGAIEPYLHRTWTLGEASFTCRGWDRIMATDEDVRECNLHEFGRRVGLYTPTDLQHRHFTQFLGACTQGQLDRAANMEVWAPLSNVVYEARTSRESHLRDPLHRLMHRIVSTSIMHREGGEKSPLHPLDWSFCQQSTGPGVFYYLPGPLIRDPHCSRGRFFDRSASVSHYGAHFGEDAAHRAAASGAVHSSTDGATPGPLAGICTAGPETTEAGGTRRASTIAAATARRTWQPGLSGSRTSLSGSGRYFYRLHQLRASIPDHSQPGPTIMRLDPPDHLVSCMIYQMRRSCLRQVRGHRAPSTCLDHRRVHCSATTLAYEIKDPFVRNYTCDTEHQAIYRLTGVDFKSILCPDFCSHINHSLKGTEIANTRFWAIVVHAHYQQAGYVPDPSLPEMKHTRIAIPALDDVPATFCAQIPQAMLSKVPM